MIAKSIHEAVHVLALLESAAPSETSRQLEKFISMQRRCYAPPACSGPHPALRDNVAFTNFG